MKNPTVSRFRLASIRAGMLFAFGLPLAGLSQALPQNPPSVEEISGDIIYLSPFVVTESDDRGYAATSTLAGTRLRTELRDIGASISIVTAEFMQDVAAVDTNTLLQYVTAGETSGIQGNFTGAGVQNDRIVPNAPRGDPQTSQRLRGIFGATVTRNFFLSDFAFDAYNTQRVTINRGPNSLLYGVGSPAGIIDTTTKPAIFRDVGEVQLRVGHRGSARATFDLNKVLISDRLALRLIGLHDDTKYKQEPSYKEDRRIYAATEYRIRKEGNDLIGRTTLRANFEKGRYGGTPPSAIPPGDAFSFWFEGLDPARFNPHLAEPLSPTFVPQSLGGTMIPRTFVDNLVANAGTQANPSNTSPNMPVFTPYAVVASLVYADPYSGTPGYGPGDPRLAGLAGGLGTVQGRPTITGPGRPPGTPAYQIRWSQNPYTSIPAFVTPTINDRRVFDYRNKLISGHWDQNWVKFQAFNAALEQSLLGGQAGFEVAFDVQWRDRANGMGFGSGVGAGANSNVNNDIHVDLALFVPNSPAGASATPIANPNVGRLVMRDNPAASTNLNLMDRRQSRVTAFYELDFKRHTSSRWGDWLGRHIFTGLYSESRADFENLQLVNVWDSNQVDASRVLSPTNNPVGVNAGNRNVVTTVYLDSNDLTTLTSGSQVRIADYFNVPRPRPGDTHTLYYLNRTTGFIEAADFYVREIIRNGNRTRNDIESQALSMQSFLFGGHLVNLVGWRTDEVKNFERIPGEFRLPDGEWDRVRTHVLQDTPSLTDKGDTFTWSVVAHYPKEHWFRLPFGVGLSAHYAESENFQANAVRRNIYGNSLPSPLGVTKEYGFSIESAERRVAARFNWFETSAAEATLGAVNALIQQVPQQIVAFLNRIEDARQAGINVATIPGNQRFTTFEQWTAAAQRIAPQEVYEFYGVNFNPTSGRWENIQGMTGINDTTSNRARGFEVEIVGSPLRNWSVSFNVAKQQTVNSDSAPTLLDFVARTQANLDREGLTNMADNPVNPTDTNTYFTRLNNSIFAPLATITAQDGQVSAEQRKWRVNLVSAYRHSEGRLRGVNYGGAIRWQDKAAVGYPRILLNNQMIPDVNRPFYAPATWAGDVWVGYGRKIRFLRDLDWRMQINVRNAIGTGGDTPAVVNPDGTVAVIRIENPTEWTLTNTFRF
jgi:outer membrane receptor protein involved in Fe transport